MAEELSVDLGVVAEASDQATCRSLALAWLRATLEMEDVTPAVGGRASPSSTSGRSGW